MADGPRLIIGAELDFEAPERLTEDEPDAIAILDPDTRPVHFYESKKALGQLFRDIDEKKFLESMQNRAQNQPSGREMEAQPMTMLWRYVQRTTQMIQWTHHRLLARKIRNEYVHVTCQQL